MKKPERAGRTSDEPAAGDFPRDVSRLAGWRPARHVADGMKAKLPTRRVTLNLDEDVVAIFKAEALRGGPPYQVAINQALRAHLREREMSDHERAARLVLHALDDQAVLRKLRSVL
jgi:uncharacterized protein (DUF4415 family)